MNLGEMIIETRERCGLVARDEMAGDSTLTTFLNHALGQIEAEAKAGWPWLRKLDQPVTLISGQNVYPFDSISQGSDIWRKVRAVRMLVGSQWQRLDPMNAEALRNAYDSTVATMPQAWSTDGYNLIIGPVPGDGWTLSLDVIIGEPALVNDSDVPLLTDVFADTLIDYAAYLLKRRTGDTNGAQVALTSYNQGIVGMRTLALRTQTGPARVFNRDQWE